MCNLFSIIRKGNSKGGYILWTDEQRAYIVNQYNLYHSVPSIASQFGCSASAIRTLLRKEKVKILTLSELKMVDYPRNSDFFEVIDTPSKAYWLGFLYSDGCLTNKNIIRITLKKEDEEHLHKFRKAISYTKNTVGFSSKKTKDKIYHQCYFTLRDNKMYADLKDKGCVERKSLILSFPWDKMDKNLYSHFIRGYIDGDGCITCSTSGKAKKPNWKLACLGTKDMLESILKIFNKPSLTLEQRGKDGSYFYEFSINGNKQLRSILRYIYQDSNNDIELTRKRQKYDTYLLQVMSGEPINVGCE